MRRIPLVFLAAAAALVLLPRRVGRLNLAPAPPPADLRDTLGGWPDLAEIHEKAGGPQSCGWCHLERREGMARRIASDPSRWIASAKPAAFQPAGVGSAVCLSCHDGASARPGPSRLRAALRGPGEDPDLGADHPVGVDYRSAQLRAPDDYNDPALRADIRLEDGKVGCSSCHLGHGRNGRLGGPHGIAHEACLACHNR